MCIKTSIYLWKQDTKTKLLSNRAVKYPLEVLKSDLIFVSWTLAKK